MKKVSSWHIGVAAEAFAAAQFARFGYNPMVQYGANQPEYDLMVANPHNDEMLKISVKGSQDGSWGLTQKYKKKENTYHDAIDQWLAAHGKKTIFCLVQFRGIDEGALPRMYLATPAEISRVMKKSRDGRGDSILYEYHEWSDRAAAAGTIDKLPGEWAFTEERVESMFEKYA